MLPKRSAGGRGVKWHGEKKNNSQGALLGALEQKEVVLAAYI
jgi:hypothetical protein